MEQADVDGVQLDYETSGTGEPVVFTHGAFIADSFRPLLAEQAVAGRYRLITYRRRGYGRSRTVDKRPISAERQAANCAGLLRRLGVERTHVVGHSFGGCVTIQLALDFLSSYIHWPYSNQRSLSDRALRLIGSPCCGARSGTARRALPR